MSKHSKQYLEQLKQNEAPSLAESVRDAAEAAKSIGGQLWDGIKPMFDHGRTELAAALFTGHAHVMYMKGNDGVEQEKEQVKESPERQNEGREM